MAMTATVQVRERRWWTNFGNPSAVETCDTMRLGRSPPDVSRRVPPVLSERRLSMHRPSAEEFLRALLETLDDLPPDLIQRLEGLLKKDNADRAQAIRELFEDVAGD
jgi:hypothetical protein